MPAGSFFWKAQEDFLSHRIHSLSH